MIAFSSSYQACLYSLIFPDLKVVNQVSNLTAYICDEPGVLVGVDTYSPEGNAGGSTPVDVAANSVLIFVYIVRGFLKDAHICGYETALKFSCSIISSHLHRPDCDWVCFKPFDVGGL